MLHLFDSWSPAGTKTTSQGELAMEIRRCRVPNVSAPRFHCGIRGSAVETRGHRSPGPLSTEMHTIW
jgi:hypothetical protein